MRKAAFATFASIVLATDVLATAAGPVRAQDVPTAPLDAPDPSARRGPLPGSSQAQSQKIDTEELNYQATRMARTIVYAFRGKAPPPDAVITFESAAAHDNMVEVKWVVTDSAFSRLKNAADGMRRVRASAYCGSLDLAYLDRGVIVHEVFARSDHSDQVDFTINNSSCGNQKCVRDVRERAQKTRRREFMCDSILPADCFNMYRRRIGERERQELAQCLR
jgi:hypothetical protein